MIITSIFDFSESVMPVQEHLKQLAPEIADRFPSIVVMYLFGSHASGAPKAASDVDVAIFTDGTQSPTMDLQLGVFLQDRLKRRVDVVVMQKSSPILQHEVLRNKIRIFEIDADRRAFLENRSLRAYLDARYYQKMRASRRKADGQGRRHPAPAEQP
jgi:predicted nucleotidyltransferase